MEPAPKTQEEIKRIEARLRMIEREIERQIRTLTMAVQQTKNNQDQQDNMYR